MIKCRIAIEDGVECQKCCLHCDEIDNCGNCCSEVEVKGTTVCSEQVEEETELQIMESAVPEAIKIITEITLQKKKLDEQEKVMKKKLQEAMEANGILKFENDRIAFTYVAPTTRTTVDAEKLKKEFPEMYKAYSKTSNVSASVRIKVK